jgi:hypothetical protein
MLALRIPTTEKQTRNKAGVAMVLAKAQKPGLDDEIIDVESLPGTSA